MKKAAPLLLSLAVGASAAHVQSPAVNARPLAAPLRANLIAQGRSTLTVRVCGPSRMPLNDIHVELQNDTYTTIGRATTDGAGRITFFKRANSLGTVRLRPEPGV